MKTTLPRTAVDLAVRPDADVLAAGAVLWRPTPDGPGIEVALVHRPRYDDWSLPKGKLDRGESMPAAALREIAEETGYTARLGTFLHDVHYPVPEGRKAVRFWSAEVLGGAGHVPNGETDELCWLPPGPAGDLLTYPHERRVLRRFEQVGRVPAVILLVRHAKAGHREQWDGPDVERPLSSTGRDQAARLAALLPAFGPERVVSAPPVRCLDTAAPLAAALPGHPAVAVDPLLGEEAFTAAPQAGLARFRNLAATPGVAVLCSQGGVIPHLVADLAHRSRHDLAVDPQAVPARKASTWVLALRGGELVAADHFSRPAG